MKSVLTLVLLIIYAEFYYTFSLVAQETKIILKL